MSFDFNEIILISSDFSDFNDFVKLLKLKILKKNSYNLSQNTDWLNLNIMSAYNQDMQSCVVRPSSGAQDSVLFTQTNFNLFSAINTKTIRPILIKITS